QALQVGLKVSFTSCLEALIELFFLGQTLHDAYRSKGLLSQGGHQAAAPTRSPSGQFDTTSVAEDGPEQQWGDRKRGQRESPVEPEHHDEHPGEQEGVITEDHGAIDDKVLNRLYVGGDAMSQIPGALTVVETKRETLHV